MAATTDKQTTPPGVLLVGSIPLDSAEEVFRSVSEVLGDRVRRVPDGETGERHNFIGWQGAVLASTPSLEQMPIPEGKRMQFPEFRKAADVEQVEFGALGYADAALSSYGDFSRLKSEGAFADEVRFQVCLPTPMQVMISFVPLDAHRDVEPAYAAAMKGELEAICAAIPHDQLAIQLDMVYEVGLWEELFPFTADGPDVDQKAAAAGRVARMANKVPKAVDLGFHFCYGDYEHEHMIQPQDTAIVVEMAGKFAALLDRSLQWIHLPVPRDRKDAAYFAPIKDLDLDETQLYLGLVHLTDGVEGTKARIETARSAVSEFGVAAECGFGRRPPKDVDDLLRIHAAVCSPVR